MRYFIAGGAGFIGSELAKRLVRNSEDEVVVYDNLSSGSLELIKPLMHLKNFSFIEGDIKDLKKLTECMLYCDVVYHFASNADIAKAISDPTVDFYEGTLLTQNILEAMRINKIKKIIYASGSGVYGAPKESVNENHSPMNPISPYGASKLAGEAMISAYCHLFDMTGIAYRFANVVGKNSTHGVIKDFIEKLRRDPATLMVMGSGEQLKGYMHVDDIIDGIFATQDRTKGFDCFNIAPDSQITVVEIAQIVIEEMGLKNVEIIYEKNTAYKGGWKGDVATIKMSSYKLKTHGWSASYESKGAVKIAVREMLGEGAK